MIFLDRNISDVLERYIGLSNNIKKGILEGILRIDHIALDEHVVEEYNVIIKLYTTNSEMLPRIYETEGKVPQSFNHKLNDGSLCLATEGEQRLYFSENSLKDWIEDYVIPYFFAVEYFKKYNKYPFGDRAHGWKGILQFYQDAFKVDTLEQAYNMLKYLVLNKYRGHALCPCGSGEKVRNCHKDINLYYRHEDRLKVLKEDYDYIEYERKLDAKNKQRAKW